MTDALRQWVANETGLTVIWSHPNAERPQRPYATTQIVSSPRVGRAYVGRPNQDGESRVLLDRDLTISVQVYESTNELDPRKAFQRCEDLRDSLDKPSVREFLTGNGFAVRAIELLQDTPQLVDTKWEPRATLDVRFGLAKELLDDVGVIEQIELLGEMTSPGMADKEIEISNIEE